MTFSKEQILELEKLNIQYTSLIKLSGMNPDKFINEFHFQFMDQSELNRNQLDILNQDRHKTFQNKFQGSPNSAF